MTTLRIAIATIALVWGPTGAATAQQHPDLAGTWTFAKQVGGPTGGRLMASARIEIAQTPAEVRIASGALFQQTQNAVYRFADNDTTSTSGGATIKGRARWDGPNLVVTATRTYAGPQGEVSVSVTDVYSLVAGNLVVEKTERLGDVSNSAKYEYAKGSLAAAVPASIPPIRRDGGPVPRTGDGKPDMSGYWNGNSRGGLSDIEPHTASFAINGGAGIVIELPDGKVPYQEWARKERDRRAIVGIATAEDPEPHCFLSGVPRQWYIMPYQIVQTPKELIGLFEYVHARRIIPITDRPHAPANLRFWEGDSRAHWEGDTLVVDVSNFNGKTWFDMAGNFASEHAHIVERYTMTDANTIRYEATIEDATVYTRPFKVAFNMERVMDRGFEILESACHEENQDLVNLRRVHAAGGNENTGRKE